MIQSGEVVVLRNGQYVTAAAPAIRPSWPKPQRSITPAPATAVPVGVRQTIYGTVTDVDSREIKIKTPNDSFEVKVPPEAIRQIKKGDNVMMDLIITPARRAGSLAPLARAVVAAAHAARAESARANRCCSSPRTTFRCAQRRQPSRPWPVRYAP